MIGIYNRIELFTLVMKYEIMFNCNVTIDSMKLNNNVAFKIIHSRKTLNQLNSGNMIR